MTITLQQNDLCEGIIRHSKGMVVHSGVSKKVNGGNLNIWDQLAFRRSRQKRLVTTTQNIKIKLETEWSMDFKYVNILYV